MNENRKTPFVLGTIVIVLALGIVLVQNSKSKKVIETSNTTQTIIDNNTGVKNTTTPKPKTYTMPEVSSHNSATSCWTAVNGSVYDVTSWISKHPGGASAIKSMCGVDASSAFDSQHGGQRRPESELASFKIGTLSK